LPSFLLRAALKIGDDRGPITLERIDIPLASLARLFD
jgi:hypothetical protein